MTHRPLSKGEMQTIAIIGGGAAGMGAAYGLVKAGFDVSLFEQGARLGGHCFGIPVCRPDGKIVRIDAGVMISTSDTS
jgi:uncharacterized protein with NAD-binding domain and iron-sulfur cluster